MSQVTVDQALEFAMRHHQSGRLAEAEQIYRQIVAQVPQHAPTLHLLGVVAGQTGRLEESAELIGRAIALCPTEPMYHNNLGKLLADRREVSQAMDAFRRALALAPDFPEAHNNLGNALTSQKRYAEAIVAYRAAIHYRPDYAHAYNSLGTAYLGDGQLAEASAAYRAALRLNANFAEAHNNLGYCLNRQGMLDEAIVAYQNALRLNPNYAEAYNNLGISLAGKGRLAEAVAAYRAALRLRPADIEAHSNLGNALNAQGLLDEAIAEYRVALRLNPAHVRALNNLGNALKDGGAVDEAVAAFRAALVIDPEMIDAHSNLVNTMQFQAGCSAEDLREELAHWNKRFAAPLKRFIRPHENGRDPGRRLRIGYVSPDFRDHVVGRNMVPLFANRDRANFGVFCYANVIRPDALTAQFQGWTDGWRTIVGVSDAGVAEMVRTDGIDILVDLALHMAGNRLLVFAHKPAPIQATFAGYPGSTGLEAIDYRLTDLYLDPEDPAGSSNKAYMEESIRLPHSFWCYDPTTDEPGVNPLPLLVRGAVTFGCLNNFCKVNAEMVALWARVLQGVLGSRLMLLAAEGSHRQQTIELFDQQGIAAERVVFADVRPRAEYLRLYHEIDIGLDTFPYNGHTTSLDSLWMGVPVVTLVGERVAGRAGFSQLMNLGLPELIARSGDEFVRTAAELAGDVPRLAALRAGLRKRMRASPLMDAKGFARGIEAAYREMWQKWCAAERSAQAGEDR